MKLLIVKYKYKFQQYNKYVNNYNNYKKYIF